MSRFSYSTVPKVHVPRSPQDLSHSVKTTMSVGKIYPIDWIEVLPNETIKSRDTNVSRISSSFLKPVMDNLYLDEYTFYIPYYLLYDKAEQVFGRAKPSAYTDDELAEIPGTYGTVFDGSVADRLGLPFGSYGLNQKVQILPFRAFALIYEWYFRNQNVIDEMLVQTGEAQVSEQFNSNEWSPNNYTGMLPNAPKIKDQFTAALPKPQKGPDVLLPLGSLAPVQFSFVGEPVAYKGGANLAFHFTGTPAVGSSYPLKLDALSSEANVIGYDPSSPEAGVSAGMSRIDGMNLWGAADLSQATASSINEQRIAWQTQKMLERDAIFGTRYNEFVLGHFGQVVKDDRLQIPELLGGKRIPLNIMQVAQTSQGTAESPLANLAAYSWTVGKARWSRHFPVHGIVMTVATLRYKHTYQQGVPKKWTRFKRDDFYDPLFATIGFQPIYVSELYKAADDSMTPLRDDVFGYNEAWIEYRRIPSYVTGQMRSSSKFKQDFWHFADWYESAPTLSKSFIEETPDFVNRCLTVPSINPDTGAPSQDMFLFDFYFDMLGIMPMPKRSTPGLVDHH